MTVIAFILQYLPWGTVERKSWMPIQNFDMEDQKGESASPHLDAASLAIDLPKKHTAIQRSISTLLHWTAHLAMLLLLVAITSAPLPARRLFPDERQAHLTVATTHIH
jgi:hypothetical protein